MKAQCIEDGWSNKIFQLSLRDRCSTIRTPYGRSFLLVDQSFFVQIKEGPLCQSARLVIDGAIDMAPIDGEPQPSPQTLIFAFCLLTYRTALFNESFSSYFRRMYPQSPLNQPLCGEPVVVESHGIVNVVPTHTPISSEKIGMAVGVNMTKMEVP